MATTAPIHQLRAWIRDPIFILGAHKSGTSLLRSLLDGHPDLYSFPDEPHFFQLTGLGVDYGLRRTPPQEITHAEMVEKMIHELERQNLTKEPQPDPLKFGGYRIATFSEAMLHTSVDSPRDLFELFHGALYQSLEGAWPSSPMRIVEKSVEYAEYAAVLAMMYPKARFIHMVRNPYSSLVSMRRMKMKGKTYPFMGPLAHSLYSSVHYAFRNRKTVPHYQVLRYEDLMMEPERSMRRLASFLDVPFRESLLQPTSTRRGTPEGGAVRVLSGGGAEIVDRWKADIHPYEVHLVNAAARPLFESKVYPQEVPSKTAATPIVGEWPVTYAANRFLLKYGI